MRLLKISVLLTFLKIYQLKKMETEINELKRHLNEFKRNCNEVSFLYLIKVHKKYGTIEPSKINTKLNCK